MRLHYCDPSLFETLGHHANACRFIADGARRRGLEVRVYGSRRITPALRDELGAQPHFRLSTYDRISRDPISGWLENFSAGWTSTHHDLSRIPDVGPDDLIYLNSGQSAEFYALIRHLRPDGPRLAIEFGLPSGLLPDGAGGYRPDRGASQPALYRWASRQMSAELASRLRMLTFDPGSAAAYAYLLERPVSALPLPHEATTSCRPRAPAASAPTIAFLGAQRLDKGGALVPDLVDRLLSTRPAVRLLVHDGETRGPLREVAALATRASGEPRLRVAFGPAGRGEWNSLLDAADLVVLPYEPARYVTAYSAIAAEAIANAIPLVVPARTTLAALLAEHGAPGLVFDEWSVPSIAGAVERAVDEFAVLAERARIAAAAWPRHHGVARLVDALLAG
jgi:glycosyltransferase involved in cell wall biosynthesis